MRDKVPTGIRHGENSIGGGVGYRLEAWGVSNHVV